LGASGTSLGSLFLGSLVGCGAGSPQDVTWSVGQSSQAFVNGGDDRREYFELSEPSQRAALERFSVALMTNGTASALVSRHVGALPTWRQINQLCDGEPFGDQPTAAFCSGVLVDYDLVLTSGHCVNVIPLESLRVAFDYYYREAGDIAVEEDDIYPVERVVVARRDDASPEDAGERLDFAWLELKDPARPPHQPAPTYTRSRGVNPYDPVISLGAGGGVPIKWDEGGHVQRMRSDFDDYFIADTDTSQGSSGGGVFDTGLALLGNLARGAPDFERTREGCYVTSTESDPTAAQEQFTYAHRAVEALCQAGSDSVLCDPTCAEPCDAAALGGALLESEDAPDDSGCAVTPGAARARSPLELLLAVGLGSLVRRRSRAVTL
jgi:Trypsin-like peptidase domain